MELSLAVWGSSTKNKTEKARDGAGAASEMRGSSLPTATLTSCEESTPAWWRKYSNDAHFVVAGQSRPTPRDEAVAARTRVGSAQEQSREKGDESRVERRASSVELQASSGERRAASVERQAKVEKGEE